MRRFPRLGALCAALALLTLGLRPCPAWAEPGDRPVPRALRVQVAQYFAPKWVLPELVQYNWLALRDVPGGDVVVCGMVNYQDSERVYVGWRAFFAVIHGDTIPTARIQPLSPVDDPVGSITNTFNLLCHRHVSAGP